MVQRPQSDGVGGGGREKNKNPPRKQDEGAGDTRGREIETRSWGERPSKILIEARDEDEGERGRE